MARNGIESQNAASGTTKLNALQHTKPLPIKEEAMYALNQKLSLS